MTVKTGSAWAGTFVTLDATGALATPSSGPAGVLYVDGTANAATVTITGSNPYKWAVTLPSLTAGQRVDMYITATIATIATAGIVASAQADTSLLSDIKTDTAAILADTGTDGVVLASGSVTAAVIATDAIDADAIKADAVTKIQNGLATAAALTTVDNEVGVIDGIVDAIKLKTDNLPADPADDSDIDAQLAAIKAETALIVEDTGTDIPATLAGLATSTALATVDENVDAILDDTGTTGVLLSTSALGSIFDDEAVVGSYTMRQLLKVMAAALAGKASGGGTTSITFRGVDDTSNVIVATVDANGNRSAVTLTV